MRHPPGLFPTRLLMKTRGAQEALYSMLRKFVLPIALAASLFVAGCSGGESSAGGSTGGGTTTGGEAPKTGDKIKIGFLVKSAQEQWFQTEWKFGREAAEKFGVELITQEVVDGEKVASQLDNLKVQGAQGVIICTPDQKLGEMIVAKCKEANMKLITVDDRLVGSDGQPLKDVHHVGIQAYDIGKVVGQKISDEMKKRNWNPTEVGAIVLTLDKLETATQRINGAMEVLKANGFPEANLYKSPWKGDVPDTKGAIDAANISLLQHPEKKKWIAIASNDDGVLGCVRATEAKGVKAEDMIGVGINGNAPAIEDLKRNTGFFGTVLLSAKQHGYGTVEMMVNWIKDGKEPQLETWTSGIPMDRSNFETVLKEQGL